MVAKATVRWRRSVAQNGGDVCEILENRARGNAQGRVSVAGTRIYRRRIEARMTRSARRDPHRRWEFMTWNCLYSVRTAWRGSHYAMHADPYTGRCYFRSILSAEEGRRRSTWNTHYVSILLFAPLTVDNKRDTKNSDNPSPQLVSSNRLLRLTKSFMRFPYNYRILFSYIIFFL